MALARPRERTILPFMGDATRWLAVVAEGPCSLCGERAGAEKTLVLSIAKREPELFGVCDSCRAKMGQQQIIDRLAHLQNWRFLKPGERSLMGVDVSSSVDTVAKGSCSLCKERAGKAKTLVLHIGKTPPESFGVCDRLQGPVLATNRSVTNCLNDLIWL
jgi:hypothetical protein